MPQRVLVIDDVDEVRTLIRRILSERGYEVDVAATLAEARGMHPHKYDVVLVDAHLGAERGIDLIDELRSRDPAAAERCLVMTGGTIDVLPDSVASLAKPFHPGELLDAIRGLRQPDAATMPDQRAGQAPDPGRATRASVRPASAPRASAPRAPVPSVSADPASDPAWRLLAITRRLRARQRDELVDFLHDGPLQDLAAATLALHMMRRSASPDAAQSFDEVLRQLDTASRSLRWLVDGNWPFLQPEDRLAISLQQRTAWLLATPITLDTSERRPGLQASVVPAIVDIVELMLLGIVDAGLSARAHVAVLSDVHMIQVELTLTAVADDVQPIGEPGTAQAWLDELASALQARAQVEPGEREWRARITLRTHGLGGAD